MKHIHHLIAVAAIALTAGACKKEFDSPPRRVLPVGEILTVADLRSLEVPGVPVKFTGDSSVYAVVTADEESGNLYRNVYVQDHTAAIVLRLQTSGGLYQGDSVRIVLKGTVLSAYQGMLQLDSVDVDNNIVKQATQVHKEPETVNVQDITPAMQGRLIRLENVQFIAADTAHTYADPVTQQTFNRTLENCAGQTVIVRNSGYANFAGSPIPDGRGSFVAVVGVFNTTMQLFIRDINEVQLNGPRCGMNECDPVAGIDEGFDLAQNNTDLLVECWINLFTQGSRPWRGGVSDDEHFAVANRASFDPVSESWLISPPITYTPGMALSFRTALGTAWAHDGLSAWVSTDINLPDGTAVTNAPWQAVDGITWAGDSDPVGEWVPSGNVALPALDPGTPFVIGFKYNATNTNTTTYRMDDVLVQ
ncbi:MAG: DUF5689 domain-containing protein [Flavobacteriales bacterium]|jgi:hypothetical protein|nr:DUF5689 domain-containing protein [Flavobacteriales bacterium]